MVVSGMVFATDPARVAEPIDQRQQERIVDFARARLMPAGIVGDLDVRDCGHRRFEAAREIALHHLHVVDVGLKMEIVGPEAFHEPQGLVAAVQEEARHVARVDRLDQELDASPARRLGGEGEVGDEGLLEDSPIGARRRYAGEAIEPRAAEFLRIVQSARDAIAELRLAAGQDCDSALAGRPVSGRQVEQRLRQAVVGEPPGDIARAVLVGRGKFDALEAGPRRRGEAVQEWQLSEQKAQVSGEIRHAGSGRETGAFGPSILDPDQCAKAPARRAARSPAACISSVARLARPSRA